MTTIIYLDLKIFYKTILSFAILSIIMLFLLRPFIISNIHFDKMIIVIASFTSAYIITMIFQAILFPNLFTPKLNYLNWNLLKHIIYNFWLLFLNGFMSFLFISSFYVDRSILFLLVIVTNVILIYSIPQFFFTLLLIRRLKSLENNICTQTNNGNVLLASSNNDDKNGLLSDNLVFIKAEDNYASFHYMVGEKILKKLKRISMYQLEQQINKSQFVRCHRSYIVNLNYIDKFEKELTGSKVILKGINNIIPVSRKNNKLLKRLVINNSPQI